MTNEEAITKLEEALSDYYIGLEYLDAIKMGRDALIKLSEQEGSNEQVRVN